MIELLIGLGFLAMIAWFIWGVVVIMTEGFNRLYWYEWVAVSGALLGAAFVVLVLAYLIGADFTGKI